MGRKGVEGIRQLQDSCRGKVHTKLYIITHRTEVYLDAGKQN